MAGKTIKQIIETASAGKLKKVTESSESSLVGSIRSAAKGKKSQKFSALLAEAGKGRKPKPISTDVADKNKQTLFKSVRDSVKAIRDSFDAANSKNINALRDSLTELQAAYGDLNELFNNTTAANDSTVASLLQDLRYVVSRLDKADFSLKYDVASGSLFVDGEDSVAVSTPDVLAMLSSLTALFPNKSISLSIDGDADYTDSAALNKLTELNGSPDPSTAAVPPVSPQEGSDIDTVLGGVGDSKISDGELTPENRFTCTYKGDTYSIWDKQLGILVKVVTTPKEADAMLDGLVAGASAPETNNNEPAEDVIEEEPLIEGEEVLDSKRVQDCTLGMDSAWDECANFDVDYIKSLGWSQGKVKAFIKGLSEGKFTPFFSQLPAFSDLNHEDNIFDLSEGAGFDYVSKNLLSTQEANKLIEGAEQLDAMSSFMTAYSNLLLSALHLTQTQQ